MYSWDDGTNYLMHHGIRGQKWGVRRYQNEDGSLTAAGRERYYNSDGSLNSRGQRRMNRIEKIRTKKSTQLQRRANYDQMQAEKYRQSAENLKKYGQYSDEYKHYSASTYNTVNSTSNDYVNLALSVGNVFLRSGQQEKDVQSLIAEYEKSAKKYEDAVKTLTDASSKIMNTPVSVVTGKRDIRREARKANWEVDDYDETDDIYRNARQNSTHFV